MPLEKIRGFRGPFLLHNQEQRAMLRAAGFSWDSTITATWAAGSFEPDGQHQTWPFTLDYGVPLNCEAGTGNCSTAERQPGLWEFPLWDIQVRSLVAQSRPGVACAAASQPGCLLCSCSMAPAAPAAITAMLTSAAERRRHCRGLHGPSPV